MGLTVMVDSVLRSSKNQVVAEDMRSNAIPWASPYPVTLGIIRPQPLKCVCDCASPRKLPKTFFLSHQYETVWFLWDHKG